MIGFDLILSESKSVVGPDSRLDCTYFFIYMCLCLSKSHYNKNPRNIMELKQIIKNKLNPSSGVLQQKYIEY